MTELGESANEMRLAELRRIVGIAPDSSFASDVAPLIALIDQQATALRDLQCVIQEDGETIAQQVTRAEAAEARVKALEDVAWMALRTYERDFPNGAGVHQIRGALSPPPGEDARRWRHLKSGHVVTEIGRGFAQVSAHPIEEMSAVVLYQHGGRFWVRNAVEFDDGRFEKVEPHPPGEDALAKAVGERD